MNTEKKKSPLLISIFVFTSMWIIYYVFEIFSGEIEGKYYILLNLFLPILFFVITALVFNHFYKRRKQGFKPTKIVIAIFVLISIEQLIKFIIRNNLSSDSSIELIKDWLYIRPFLNSLGSWGASRFGIKLGINSFTVLNIVGIPLIIQAYRCYVYEKGKSFWGDLSFVLFLSGGVCSLIDKLFFGGSLDYLSIGNLFIADLKDFYLTLSMGCLLNEMLITNEVKLLNSQEEEGEMFKKFIQFNKMDISRIKKKVFNKDR
jgi:signal peptidase II